MCLYIRLAFVMRKTESHAERTLRAVFREVANYSCTKYNFIILECVRTLQLSTCLGMKKKINSIWQSLIKFSNIKTMQTPPIFNFLLKLLIFKFNLFSACLLIQQTNQTLHNVNDTSKKVFMQYAISARPNVIENVFFQSQYYISNFIIEKSSFTSNISIYIYAINFYIYICNFYIYICNIYAISIYIYAIQFHTQISGTATFIYTFISILIINVSFWLL